VTENVIEVNNLEHKYGDLKAVDNISFTVRKGEIFSFLGPNGAGKSTVINILTTLRKIQKGEAKVNGYDVAKESKAVRKSIGIVFQMMCLDYEMTVLENLEYHGKIYSMPKNERRNRINELIKLTATEYSLLSLFVKNEGKVLTHQYLLRQIWGPGYINQTQYLRVFVAQLRKKIENDPYQPEYILTESGIGYRFIAKGTNY